MFSFGLKSSIIYINFVNWKDFLYEVWMFYSKFDEIVNVNWLLNSL